MTHAGGTARDTLEADLPGEGELVDGKYRIGRTVGLGAMGKVVAAYHLRLHQNVAIKFLLRNAGEKNERFLREARAALTLQSEHVVRVHDVGTLPDGTPFLVMELLEGTDLAALLRRRTKLAVSEAVDYVLQACAGLAEAHARGIVHRDLKPSNLFVTHRANGAPLVKVLDFGISKFTAASEVEGVDLDLTASRVVLGSPVYMSPEQLRNSKTVDARTDVWALGVVLYTLLSGVRPFEAESLTALCAAIAADPPRPLRDEHPEVPAALEAAIIRCLAKERSKRVGDVAEVVALLAPFASADGRVIAEHIVHNYEGALGVARSTRTFDETSSAVRQKEPGDARFGPADAETAVEAPRLDSLKPASVAPMHDPADTASRRRSRRRAAWLVGAAAALGVGALAIALTTHRTDASPAPVVDVPASGGVRVPAAPEPSVAPAPIPESTTTAAVASSAANPPPVPPRSGSRAAPRARPSSTAKPYQRDHNNVPIIE